MDSYLSYTVNRIGCVMVIVLASSVVDRGFEPRSGQTKHYKIGICCFSAKHTERAKTGWQVVIVHSVMSYYY
jgi:hypothetical protein